MWTSSLDVHVTYSTQRERIPALGGMKSRQSCSVESMSSSIKAFGRWARLKKYRIEVTYGVYVFTPGEKLAFWSILSLLFSLVAYYMTLFVSRNVVFIVHSAWSLLHGANNSGSDAAIAHVVSGLGAQLTHLAGNPAGNLAGHAPSRSAH
ncbi:hypothetical protein SLS62_001011 [Diatrype stigma]|uniref:Uncharacterized protein n=1 Tax=Diatrype stigma TaxID=117547 RepID=A0AAN9YX41_9PEZI